MFVSSTLEQISGYIVFIGVPPKLQPNLFVSSTYSKYWVYCTPGCGANYKVQPMFVSST